MNKKIIVLILFIITAIGYLIVSSFLNNKVGYFSVSELVTNKNFYIDKNVKVIGTVVANSLLEKINGNEKVYKFKVKDKDTGKNEIEVIYSGIIPDSLQSNGEVICSGMIKNDNIFYATSLIAKCPSKYESKGDKHPDEIKMEKD